MIKRISLCLVLTMAISLVAGCAMSTVESPVPTETRETIVYDDGSYLVVTTVASGLSTTVVVEDSIEVITQSNLTANDFGCFSLSYPAGLEDQEADVRQQEDMENFSRSHNIIWITKDGIRIPVDLDRNGMPVYQSEVATKHCSYYSADDRLLWTMSLTGIFRENAINRNCDILSSKIEIYETDSWYVISDEEHTDTDAVSYTVQFGRRNLGVTIAKASHTITLERDSQGTFH